MDDITWEDAEAFDLLCKQAESEKHRKFEYLGCMEELFRAKDVKRSLKKTIKMFDRLAKSCVKAYSDLLESGKDDVILVVSMANCAKYARYYEEELRIVKDMIDEYHYYFLTPIKLVDNVILGIYRPEEDMRDFRYKQSKFFEDR